MAPFIGKIAEYITTLSPPRRGYSPPPLAADRRQKQQDELQKAGDKLRTHGTALTPTKHSISVLSHSAPSLPVTAPAPAPHPLDTSTILNPNAQTLHDCNPPPGAHPALK